MKTTALPASSALMAGLCLALAACAEPDGSDTANMAADATTADVTADGIAGDSSAAPDMATVQLALEEACPTMGPALRLREVACEADDLGGSFDCTFAFTGDPADTQRNLGITQAGGGWTVDAEPALCNTLDRADAMADEPADASVDTQPIR